VSGGPYQTRERTKGQPDHRGAQESMGRLDPGATH